MRRVLPHEAAKWKSYYDSGPSISDGGLFILRSMARFHARNALVQHNQDTGEFGYYTLTDMKGRVIERKRLVPHGTEGAEGGRWLDETPLIQNAEPPKRRDATQVISVSKSDDPGGRGGFDVRTTYDGEYAGHISVRWLMGPGSRGPVLERLVKTMKTTMGHPFVHVSFVADAFLRDDVRMLGPNMYFTALVNSKREGMPMASGPEPSIESMTEAAVDAGVSSWWQSKFVRTYCVIAGTEQYFLGWPRTA